MTATLHVSGPPTLRQRIVTGSSCWASLSFGSWEFQEPFCFTTKKRAHESFLQLKVTQLSLSSKPSNLHFDSSHWPDQMPAPSLILGQDESFLGQLLVLISAVGVQTCCQWQPWGFLRNNFGRLNKKNKTKLQLPTRPWCWNSKQPELLRSRQKVSVSSKKNWLQWSFYPKLKAKWHIKYCRSDLRKQSLGSCRESQTWHMFKLQKQKKKKISQTQKALRHCFQVKFFFLELNCDKAVFSNGGSVAQWRARQLLGGTWKKQPAACPERFCSHLFQLSAIFKKISIINIFKKKKKKNQKKTTKTSTVTQPFEKTYPWNKLMFDDCCSNHSCPQVCQKTLFPHVTLFTPS